MYNNILYIFFIALLVCCSSCNNNSTISSDFSSMIRFAKDTLSIDNMSNKDILIFVQGENVMSFTNSQEKSLTISLLDVVRKCKDKNKTAYKLLKIKMYCKLKSLLKMK